MNVCIYGFELLRKNLLLNCVRGYRCLPLRLLLCFNGFTDLLVCKR